MCELLVCARDLAPEAEPGHHLRHRRGDVIHVAPDGWRWGREEGPPLFAIVKVPGVPERDMAHLLGPMPARPGGGLPHRRELALDLDRIPADGSRPDIAGATIRRTPAEDTHTIGTDPGVIG